MTTVRIDRRFRGPPDSGNGGYFAGLLAKELGSSGVAVTLRQPGPLDADLNAEGDGERATLRRGEEVIATAERAEVEIDVPEPPSLDRAHAAEERFRAEKHIYPGCFVCGPERQADGLCIFPGPTSEGRVAAGWAAEAEFGDADGHVKPEFIWAALDCPGYFAVQESAGLALLGRMAVVIHRPVPVGEPLIVQGWSMGGDGRKHRAGTALHLADGKLLAAAEQVWITLKRA